MPHSRLTPSSGITKPKRPQRTLFERRRARNTTSTSTTSPSTPSPSHPTLSQKLAQLRLPLAPIVHASTGLAPSPFPRTLLALFLLTEPQLDALAAFYSQTTLSELTHAYPSTMNWTHPFLDADAALPPECRLGGLERLKVKMRMFARFIGLRGADTPTWEYERQVEILAEKARWRVRLEEEERERKGWSGLL